jgi:hypothetical protein
LYAQERLPLTRIEVGQLNGEKAMPVIRIWTVPAVIAVGVTGYYLVAVSHLIDTALGLAIPPNIPLARRRQFRVIEGGKPPLALADIPVARSATALPAWNDVRRLRLSGMGRTDWIYLAVISSALLLLFTAAGLVMFNDLDLMDLARTFGGAERK